MITDKKYAYIIDDFKNADVDIDGDNIGEISHGKIVEAIIKNINPNIEIIRLQMETMTFVELSKHLKNIDGLFAKGFHIDAVVMSLDYSIKIAKLAKETNLNLLRENLNENYENICQWLEKLKPEVFNNIKEIESLTNKGIKVYIASGNEGLGYVNLFNLAKNSIDVGATKQPEDFTANFSDNALIDRHEEAILKIKCLQNGYDLNNDGSAEILIPPNLHNETEFCELKGTSYAVPIAVSKDLLYTGG